MVRFSDNTKILKHENKVLYENCENGKWLRVSEEVAQIISYYIDNVSQSFCEKVNFEDEEDERFFNSIIEKLFQFHIIVQDDLEEDEKKSSVTIEITNNCNLRCKHCCVNAGEKNDYEFSTNELKDILKKCVDWKPYNIALSGGEPMLRKDFFYILEYLRKIYTGIISLSTNGTLINEDNVEKLCSLVDQIDISIDGVDEESCAKIRGKGIFNKVINSVKLIQGQGFNNISLSMVFSETNESLEEQFYELNRQLKTKPLPRIYADLGRAKANREQFIKKGRNEAYIPLSFLKEQHMDELGFCSCSAGKKMVFIRYDGSVFPCPSFMKEKYLMYH